MTRREALLLYRAKIQKQLAEREAARTHREPIQLDLFQLPLTERRPLTERDRAAIRREVRNLEVGRTWARRIRHEVFGEDFGEIDRLAKIDCREVYTEDLFVDSSEWIARRDAEWLENTAAYSRID
jgi:hypothetical protein